MLAVLRTRPAVRAAVLAAYILLVEYARTLSEQIPYAVVPALAIGGAALALAAWGWPAERIGLGTTRLATRVVGGLALAVVLLIPTAARVGAMASLPLDVALAAVLVSVGEEIAFRGALFAALEDVGGGGLAVVGTTAIWTAAHALSHPPQFLFAVAAAGLLLGIWRMAFRDLVGPIIAHVIADLAL
ncbi:MAG TPA: CPBP family intramembrane glutamic endopeptidase [Candidatus Dormibacteraeota bacterium]|nr:CPBP family intramembrane glutamic endopeptidase [Candidatus Dormibacteraeota bacterium]